MPPVASRGLSLFWIQKEWNYFHFIMFLFTESLLTSKAQFERSWKQCAAVKMALQRSFPALEKRWIELDKLWSNEDPSAVGIRGRLLWSYLDVVGKVQGVIPAHYFARDDSVEGWAWMNKGENQAQKLHVNASFIFCAARFLIYKTPPTKFFLQCFS